MSDNFEHKKVKQAHAEAPGPAANFLLMSAGSIFTSMLIAGFIVGYMLDQIFDTTPIFFLSCAVLGFIGGIQKVHTLSKRLNYLPSDEKKESKEGKETQDDQKS
ncbi:MAG TPA: AtpZ/AtpI family protein [Thiomicrospira sp.]|jgi:ATP synthase protein I|nr:AtpZ/AtpI family protein [Thiomicrospira sp.]